jgi:hypothetical protein
VSGIPTFTTVFFSTLDQYGEATFGGFAPDDAGGLEFTLISFAEDFAGQGGYRDSNLQTIVVQ